MDEKLQHHVKRLWQAYNAYHRVSCRNGSDGKQYATECTNDFLEYLDKCTNQPESPYNWGDWSGAIENQIRILQGFIECYDRPIKRDKITNKTRWSV